MLGNVFLIYLFAVERASSAEIEGAGGTSIGGAAARMEEMATNATKEAKKKRCFMI